MGTAGSPTDYVSCITPVTYCRACSKHELTRASAVTRSEWDESCSARRARARKTVHQHGMRSFAWEPVAESCPVDLQGAGTASDQSGSRPGRVRAPNALSSRDGSQNAGGQS